MEYDQQFSATYPLNGEWSVSYEYVNSGGIKIVDGPHLIYVFNTAANKDSVWIQDQIKHNALNFAPYQFKANANMSDFTFTSKNSPDISNDDICTVKNGKIVNKDSIYFEINFKVKDPNTTYKVYGHRRNSYDEYMNP
ncbi:MAG: lipid-binding protein [Bacteroidota bacterium]|nr:lipid-binding protein [Bacteroidota bacterium]